MALCMGSGYMVYVLCKGFPCILKWLCMIVHWNRIPSACVVKWFCMDCTGYLQKKKIYCAPRKATLCGTWVEFKLDLCDGYACIVNG